MKLAVARLVLLLLLLTISLQYNERTYVAARWISWPKKCTLHTPSQPYDILVDIDTPKTGSLMRRQALLKSCELQGGRLPIRIVSKTMNEEQCPASEEIFIPPSDWHTGVAIYEETADKAKHFSNQTDIRIFAFTTLRDPIPRFVSEWAELASGRDMWSSLPHQNKTLMEILRTDLSTFAHYINCPAYNRQTWMLGQTKEIVEIARRNYIRTTGNSSSTFKPGLFFEMWKWYYDGAPNYVDKLNQDDNILDIAKRTLENLTLFGITEQRAKSWDMFNQVFHNATIYSPPGFESISSFLETIPPHTHKHSKTTFSQLIEDPEFSSLHEKIIQKNRLDLELYRFATELFEQRVQRCFSHKH